MAPLTARIKATLPPMPTFRAWRYPNFRWFWGSAAGQAVGQGMQFLALGWLVLERTDSVAQLGLVIFFYGIPNLTLVLLGGIIADRIDRRALLLVTQGGVTVIILMVATLTLLDLVAVGHIYAAAFLLGTCHAVNMPTRLAIVVNLVGREDIMNAVTLNSAVLNTGRVVGPAVAGGVIELLGIAASLYLNALCYLLSVGFLLLIKGVEQTRPARRANPLRDLLAGLDYFRKTPVVFTIIGMGFAFGFFGMPHIQVMPAFAREALGRGAGEAGLLITAAGVGSLLVNIILASLGNARGKNWLLLGFILTFAVSLFIFAWSQWYWLSWIILLFVGMGSNGYISLGTTILQLTVSPELQGRVMSLWYVSAGFMFIGSLPMALVAERISWPAALAGGAALCLACTLIMGVWRPTLRQLRI